MQQTNWDNLSKLREKYKREQKWKEIHSDFTPELQREWRDRALDYEECKKWIDFGLQPTEADYAEWLRYVKRENPQSFFKHENKIELRTEYQEYKNWESIHPDFTGSWGNNYQNKWRNYGFTLSETKLWMKSGLEPEDYELAAYVQAKGCQFSQIKKEELQEELKKSFVKLDRNYEYWTKLNFTPIEVKAWLLAGLTVNEHEFAGYCRRQGYNFSATDIKEAKKGYIWHLDLLDKKELQKNWAKSGVSTYQEFKIWLSVGLSVDEHEFTSYLVKQGYQLTTPNLKEIVIQESWRDIDKHFSYQRRREWEKIGYNKEQTKNWIGLGFRSNGYSEVGKWIEQGFNYEQVKKWIEEVKISSSDIEFIIWLRNIKKDDLEWILNNKEDYEKLRKSYQKQKWGLCKECNDFNTGRNWCKSCNSSGDIKIDEFIQNYFELEPSDDKNFPELQILKWIPYEQFTDIKYLAEGGFGKIYKTKWVDGNIFCWNIKYCKEEKDKKFLIPTVAVLKILNNCRKITKSFLREFINNMLVDNVDENDGRYIVRCYGISQDPKTKNYVMVMDYIENGNLREYLRINYNKLDFSDRLVRLSYIAMGLNSIHQQGLVHRDFHPGNILVFNYYMSYIADLGLSGPVSEEDEEKIYGVLSYIAPEVLNKEPYTQASDIYSFGVVAYEIFSCFPPYYYLEHDAALASLICKGLRAQFQIKIPSLLKNMIERCWDADPTQRPTSRELNDTFSSWLTKQRSTDSRKNLKKNTEFYRQYREIVEKFSQALSASFNTLNFDYKLHPQAIYTSRLLDFRELSKPQNSKEVNDKFYSELSIDSFKFYHSEELDFDIEMKTKEVVEKEKNDSTELELDIEISTKELTKRLRTMSMEEANQKETKSVKLDKIAERQELYSEPMEIDQILILDYWQKVHCNFTLELVQEWVDYGFTIEQCHDWISINSLAQQEREIRKPTYYAWLRDIKQVNVKWVLNHGNLENLNQEFFTWWQEQQLQTNIEQPPK
ncbi:MAG: protein kinase [Candidatus Moeniiplasma glomeromycotorum]|nr:protein kinase [Candidatus Moeniiplasma glomeromycotorum]MCE8167279.1 protein kinase [Candidatus Moeniiplasma glomeromycotorum]MCE8168708.1 protein kinase [Candidatus Moeniiplasma glomeromycotorum]